MTNEKSQFHGVHYLNNCQGENKHAVLMNGKFQCTNKYSSEKNVMLSIIAVKYCSVQLRSIQKFLILNQPLKVIKMLNPKSYKKE